MKRALVAIMLASAVVAAADDPPPMLRARLDPPGPVVTGQTVRLVVDVLTTTFFTGAPGFPAIELPGAVVALSDEAAGKLTERIDGAEWFGLSRAYLVTPTVGGTIAIPPIEVVVHPGPDGAPVTLKTSPLSLVVTEAQRPAGAEHAVGTSRLEVTQTLDRNLDGIRAGDAVTRTITITADGARAMFLPPTAFPSVKGLAVYPANPIVEDVTKDRVGFAGGRRVDAATYVVQAAGRYELAAVTVPWWNTRTNALETASVPAVSFTAATNPAFRPEIALPDEDAEPASIARGAVVGTAIVIALLSAWLVAPYVRRAKDDAAERRAERRTQWEASEEWAFERLRDATRAGDPKPVYVSLVRWLGRFEGVSDVGLRRFCETANDAALTRQCDALEAELFGGGVASAAWSGSALYDEIARVRAASRERRRPAPTPTWDRSIPRDRRQPVGNRKTNAKRSPQSGAPVGPST